MKKVIIGVVAFLVVCTIASASTFDTKGFRFSVAGDKQEIESSKKISGTIFLRSEYSNNQYDGELAFSLIKHGLFNDSLVGRQQKSTKGFTIRTADFSKCSTAKYEGTLLLNKADSWWTAISGDFMFEQL